MKTETRLRLAKAKAARRKLEQTQKEDHVQTLKDEISRLATEVSQQNQTVDLDPLLEAIKSLESKLKPTDIDLTPVIEQIKAIKPQVTVNNPKPEVKSTIIKQEDVFSVYKPADTDETDEFEKYYGFIANNGKWFILREQGDENKAIRYSGGDKDYPMGWKDRRSLQYGYFNRIRI